MSELYSNEKNKKKSKRSKNNRRIIGYDEEESPKHKKLQSTIPNQSSDVEIGFEDERDFNLKTRR
jgi:hypothetical protein